MSNLINRFTRRQAPCPQDKLYEVAANIALKYGGFGDNYVNINQESVNEFWNSDTNCPSCYHFKANVRVKTIKWYIHHKMSSSYDIWSSDFLHGLMTHGKIKWNVMDFPTFVWSNDNNNGISALLKNCPFGGKIRAEKRCPNKFSWSNVPALYLKHSKDSLEFIAGIMSGAQLFTDNGYKYAKFSSKVRPHLEKFGIPIDYTDRRFILISPIWPALFTPKMPVELREQWLHLKKPLKAHMYSAILWKTYIDSTFPPKAIPYLKSARMLFYEYECDEGAMRKLDLLRIETGLSSLSPQIKEMVKIWGEKYEHNKSIVKESLVETQKDKSNISES